MNDYSLKITAKIFVAFEDKLTDKILIEEFYQQSEERGKYFLKYGAGSLLLESSGLKLIIEPEDIYYLLCNTLPLLIKTYIENSYAIYDLWSKENYRLSMEVNEIDDDFLAIREYNGWENDRISQEIGVKRDEFILKIYDVITNFIPQYLAIKELKMDDYHKELLEFVGDYVEKIKNNCISKLL